MSRDFSRFRGFVTKQPLNRVEETRTKTYEARTYFLHVQPSAGGELWYDEPRDSANFSPSLPPEVKLLHTKRPLLLRLAKSRGWREVDAKSIESWGGVSPSAYFIRSRLEADSTRHSSAPRIARITKSGIFIRSILEAVCRFYWSRSS